MGPVDHALWWVNQALNLLLGVQITLIYREKSVRIRKVASCKAGPPDALGVWYREAHVGLSHDGQSNDGPVGEV